MPVTELLVRNAREHGDEIALVELNPSMEDPRKLSFKEYDLVQQTVAHPYRREITWSDFNKEANRFANLLLPRGVKKGDKVAVLLMNCIEWLPIYFGVLKAGAMVVPLNYRYTAEEIRYCIDLADVDVIVYGDDVAMQTGMMMSPAVWREFLKPLLADVIAAAKAVKPDVLVYYHTDGDCTAIIDDLIEVGVEILNPVQPECLDPLAVYENYHDRLAVWGAIGTQTTMPFGTPEQVRSKTTELLQAARRHGKMVLAPTHLLEPEVPLENIDTFVKTVREFRA